MKLAPKCERQNILKFSYRMTAKMTNVLSLSTNCNANQICRQRAKIAGSICSHCFAASTLSHYTSLDENTLSNFWILTTSELSNSDCEKIALEIVSACRKKGTHEFRLESFGDLANELHAMNYLNILFALYRISKRENYKVICGWWTKNVNLLIAAYDKLDRDHKSAFHKVCHLLISSMFCNQPIAEAEKAEIERQLEMPVSVFTVYEPDFIQKNDIAINCGARSCRSCKRCYSLSHKGEHIREELK